VDVPQRGFAGNAQPINWFPGHIATASKQLAQTLKSTDIVIEVRDGRIPHATSHPSVLEWSGGKPRIVVVTRPDCIPYGARKSWERFWSTLSLGKAGKDEYGVDRVEDKNILNMLKQVAEQRQKYVNEGWDYNPLKFIYLNGKEVRYRAAS